MRTTPDFAMVSRASACAAGTAAARPMAQVSIRAARARMPGVCRWVKVDAFMLNVSLRGLCCVGRVWCESGLAHHLFDLLIGGQAEWPELAAQAALLVSAP